MDAIAKSEMDKASIVQVLCTAIERGYFPRSRKILDYVCSCHEDTAAYMNLKNDDGKTMLHVAAFHSRPNWVRTLIFKGSDVNETDDDGKTALYYAVKGRSLCTMKAVLDSKPNLGLTYGPNKLTVVHLAAQRKGLGNFFLKALFEAGAKANDTDAREHTPLHFAAGMSYSAKSMCMIIEAGCDVNAQRIVGDTPLHSACKHLKPGAVKLLLRHGADETLANNKGQTAADVIGKRIGVDDRDAEDVNRIKQLLENAPSDRAWYRRASVVMCHKFYVTQPGVHGVPGVPKKRHQPNRSCALPKRTDWEGAVHWLFSRDTPPGIFRWVVTYLW